MLALTIALLVILAFASAAPIPDEDWGYAPIRGKGQMFWWLYGMEDKQKRDAAPLVVWLQGGPGASSTGYGNFMEIGPLDLHQNPRPVHWVQSANILFIDNPVGSGFSYVTDSSGYATTDEQIGKDLVDLIESFYGLYPALRANPFWIFCESYGGKMAASFGVEILKSHINTNFKGVALGDSWIDPISFVMEWGPYLYNTAEIEQKGFDQIMAAANKTLAAVNSKQWAAATNLWGDAENVVQYVSDNVNFYNILDRRPASQSKKTKLFSFGNDDEDLDKLMNTVIKKKLGIPESVTWGGQSGYVFRYLQEAFMQPFVTGVDLLLSAGVEVVIYSGNLDLICCTTGTVDWMEQLKWTQMPKFWDSTRHAIKNPTGETVAFKKQFQNLQFWTVLSAGHMVPTDQPVPAQILLETVIGTK